MRANLQGSRRHKKCSTSFVSKTMIQCTNGCTSQQAACSCSGIDSSRSSVYLCKVGSSILCHCQHQRPDYGADICSFRFFCSVKPMSPVSNTENICPTMSYHQCVDEFQRYVFSQRFIHIEKNQSPCPNSVFLRQLQR